MTSPGHNSRGLAVLKLDKVKPFLFGPLLLIFSFKFQLFCGVKHQSVDLNVIGVIFFSLPFFFAPAEAEKKNVFPL